MNFLLLAVAVAASASPFETAGLAQARAQPSPAAPAAKDVFVPKPGGPKKLGESSIEDGTIGGKTAWRLIDAYGKRLAFLMTGTRASDTAGATAACAALGAWRPPTVPEMESGILFGVHAGLPIGRYGKAYPMWVSGKDAEETAQLAERKDAFAMMADGIGEDVRIHGLAETLAELSAGSEQCFGDPKTVLPVLKAGLAVYCVPR